MVRDPANIRRQLRNLIAQLPDLIDRADETVRQLDAAIAAGIAASRAGGKFVDVTRLFDQRANAVAQRAGLQRDHDQLVAHEQELSRPAVNPDATDRARATVLFCNRRLDHYELLRRMHEWPRSRDSASGGAVYERAKRQNLNSEVERLERRGLDAMQVIEQLAIDHALRRKELQDPPIGE